MFDCQRDWKGPFLFQYNQFKCRILNEKVTTPTTTVYRQVGPDAKQQNHTIWPSWLVQCFDQKFVVVVLSSFYRCGPLIDLCRGPHVRHTGKIKALKIYKVCSETARTNGATPQSDYVGSVKHQRPDLVPFLYNACRNLVPFCLCSLSGSPIFGTIYSKSNICKAITPWWSTLNILQFCGSNCPFLSPFYFISYLINPTSPNVHMLSTLSK